MLAEMDVKLTDGEFRRISEVVYQHCGINLHDGKVALVRARLAKRMRHGGFASVSDYMDFVETDSSGEEFTQLIDAISTNLTSFFRERRHFDYLGAELLPRLMNRRRQDGKFRIRGWSAACSTGEEPYSLAITLHESAPAHEPWDIKLLATDISTRVLKIAREGTYDKQRLAPLSAAQKSRYFEPAARMSRGAQTVGSALRDIVRFRHLNLMERWPFDGSFDFIFCRNVMIYFDKPTQQRLVQRFWEILDSGGTLFTGHSESLTGISHKFQYVEPTIYLKK
jgi:chemotaxis protein methyltransferase CheR